MALGVIRQTLKVWFLFSHHFYPFRCQLSGNDDEFTLESARDNELCHKVCLTCAAETHARPPQEQRWRTGKIITNNHGNNNHTFYSNCTFITELQKHLAPQATIQNKKRQQQVESEVQGGGGDGEE